jgi:hypothetical protein
MRRLGRSLAWRLRRVAMALAAPEDLNAWRIEHNALDMAAAARVIPISPASPVSPVASVDAVSAGGTVGQDDVLGFCRRLAPHDVEGHRKVRLGGENDGGYVFIDDFSEVNIVISCGISNDVSCDLAFAELGKDIIQFDHTVEGPPVAHSRFDFRKQAIDELRVIPGSTRLSDVIRGLGEAGKSDLVLKIDIDGGEWTTFAKMPAQDLARCRQVACEFHDTSKLGDLESYALYKAAIATILENFFPAHLHANNFAGFAIVAGVPIPKVFEVTFVNRKFYSPSSRQHVGPMAVDAPNNENAPDLFLGSPFLLASH